MQSKRPQLSAVPEGYLASLVCAPSCLHDTVVDVAIQNYSCVYNMFCVMFPSLKHEFQLHGGMYILAQAK